MTRPNIVQARTPRMASGAGEAYFKALVPVSMTAFRVVDLNILPLRSRQHCERSSGAASGD